MKATILALTTLAVAGAGLHPAAAGDREWATAGKILTGVVAASVVAQALQPAPCASVAYYPAPVVVAPAPPVYVQTVPMAAVAPLPPPLVVQPAPVYVAPTTVIVRPAPVLVPAPPVWVVRRPVVSFSLNFGFAPRHHLHQHYRHGW